MLIRLTNLTLWVSRQPTQNCWKDEVEKATNFH